MIMTSNRLSLLACLLITLAGSQAVHDPELSLCGGNVTSKTPEFSSPGYPNPYPGGEDCVWTIITDNNTQIYLTFVEFSVDGPGDVVEVYDFDEDDEMILLGSFSGNKDPFIIISTSNKLQVNFTSTNTSISTNLQRKFEATFSTKGCGSTLNDFTSGVLSAPIYDSQRMPAKEVMSCSWQINANKNHKVALSFADTNLGNTSSLEVKDGFGEKTPLLANYSGDVFLPDVISNQNQVFVKLTFELEFPPKLQATFTEVTGDCSGRIRLTDTNMTKIQSPNYPKPYPNKLDCRWLVESTNSMATLVVITTSYTVADVNDVLVVHDGSSRSTKLLWSFIGAAQDNSDLPLLVSSGQALWLKFTTDEAENQGYFSMNISMQESGGLVTKDKDPYFPASAQFTVYQCVAPEGYQCVFFTSFWNCTFNSSVAAISVYEGQFLGDNLLRRYTESYTGEEEATPAFSNGRMMMIIATMLGHGGNCVGSEIRMLDANSYHHSYGQMGSRIQLPLNTLYNGWVIHPNTTAGSLLQISILKLDLIFSEWITISQVSQGETEELISIYKEWNGALIIYVEPISPVSIVYYDLPIAADRTAVYSISYTMLSGCEKLLNATQDGYVTSPEYPNTYPLNADCSWKVTVQENHLIHIIFEDLHIPGNHYMRLTSPPNQRNIRGIHKTFSGDVTPNNLIANSSEFSVDFNSTDIFTYPGRGFKLHYEAIDCGGHMTDLKGYLAAPSNITQNLTCMWILELPPVGDSGKSNIGQVTFDYKLLEMQSKTNWFEIRDGPNSDSILMEELGDSINGTNITTVTVLSRANHVFVSYFFRPDDPSQRGFPFNVTYNTYTCQYNCDNGVCLQPLWRCDGVDQCGDNSDERGCSDPVPNCKGIPVHVVATWILGVSIVAAFIVAVIATVLAMRVIRKYKSEHPGDRTLLVQDD